MALTRSSASKNSENKNKKIRSSWTEKTEAKSKKKKSQNSTRSSTQTESDHPKQLSRSCSSSSSPPIKRTKNPGVRLIGGTIYDSENGKTCHQWRRVKSENVGAVSAKRPWILLLHASTSVRTSNVPSVSVTNAF
ncbi:unnamed protein product [Ilex paraguariensis]|uniref:Uncharacterized protein n=1 Tax=Ilex paraguariensis TaxID=185542 RepID=A0ABC8RUJ8_9AQUA